MIATFENCLKNRRIIHFPDAVHLVEPEIDDAVNDLRSAKDEFKRDSCPRSIAFERLSGKRALLPLPCYQGVVCQRKETAPKLIEDFKNSMILREDADYGREFSKQGAAATIKCAEAFLKEAKRILKI